MAILNHLGVATPYSSGRKRISWSVTEMFVEQSLDSPKSAKNIWGKLQKSEPELKLWTLRPRGLHFMELLDTTKNKSPAELRSRPRKGSNKQFFFFYLFWKFLILSRGLSQRRSRQKSLLDGVTDLLAKIWQRNSVSLHFCFYQEAQKHLCLNWA